MGLKENIKMYRNRCNLTLEEVASKIGISKPTLQRYESGVISNIPAEKIEGMAKIFGISPSQLMGWDYFDEKYNKNGKLTNDVQLIEIIEKDYGKGSVTLLNNYSVLNETGQAKAFEYVSDLAEQPKYRKNLNK